MKHLVRQYNREYLDLQISSLKEYLYSKPFIIKLLAKVSEFKPRHWFLAGFGFYFSLNIFFGIIEIITVIFTGISITLLAFFVGLAETVITLWGEPDVTRVYDILDAKTDEEVLTSGISYYFSFLIALGKGFAEVGKGIHDLLAVNFPMLYDIDFDLPWIHISVPYISRAFFAFAQFIILFYIMRRIKRAIKNRIKKRISLLDNDYFDKQYFGVIRVA